MNIIISCAAGVFGVTLATEFFMMFARGFVNLLSGGYSETPYWLENIFNRWRNTL